MALDLIIHERLETVLIGQRDPLCVCMCVVFVVFIQAN